MNHYFNFIIFLLGITIGINSVKSFHIPIVRPELNVIDVHPYYFISEKYLSKPNYSTEYSNQNLYTNTNEHTKYGNFYEKNSRANIFGFLVLLLLIAHHLNLLPN